MTNVRYQRTPARAIALLVALWLLALPLPSSAATPLDVVLVLDNSGSMKANDPAFLLKRAVAKFVSALEADMHVGIVIFDEKVSYPVPLAALNVESRASIQRAIESIDYRGKFTNSPAGIERAVYELKKTARADASRIIIFFTDGIVDTGNPAVDAEKANWMRSELAADAADSKIKIFGVAFTENADFFLIQSLAKTTGGEYFRAIKPEDLSGVFDTVGEAMATAPPPVEPVPLPPSVAQPTEALGTCMSSLTAEERIGIAEAAAQSGLNAESLCVEMQQAPQGTAVVVPPPATEEAEPKLKLFLAAGAGLLVAAIIAFLFTRRRAPAVAAPSAPVTAGPPPVPEAFIKDINGITDDPAIQLSAKPLMIGRTAGNEPAHLDYFVVNKGTIGRRHAMIKYRDFSFWIADQGSVNGTFLNGERIENERQLKHGDRIKFHKYEFEFSMPEMEDSGHTVFADPSDVTMIGDVAALPSRAVAPKAPVAVVAADEDDVFDLTGGIALPAASSNVIDESEATALSARADGGQDIASAAAQIDFDADDGESLTVAPGGPVPTPAEAAFDAEASAFFDDGMLGVTSMPTATGFAYNEVETLAGDQGFDDFSAAETAIRQTPMSASESEEATQIFASKPSDDEDGESVTLLPSSVPRGADLEATTGISIDDFMKTDSFEPPVPGMAEDDFNEDATLLPGQVPALVLEPSKARGGSTAASTPPARNSDDDEGPTVFQP